MEVPRRRLVRHEAAVPAAHLGAPGPVQTFEESESSDSQAQYRERLSGIYGGDNRNVRVFYDEDQPATTTQALPPNLAPGANLDPSAIPASLWGLPGSPGTNGAPGPPGPKGPKGPAGAAAVNGTNGSNGTATAANATANGSNRTNATAAAAGAADAQPISAVLLLAGVAGHTLLVLVLYFVLQSKKSKGQAQAKGVEGESYGQTQGSIIVQLTVYGVNFATLEADPAQLASFEYAVQEGLAQEAGSGLTTEDVGVSSGAGENVSVMVSARVTPPTGVPVNTVYDTLYAATGGSLAERIAAQVSAIGCAEGDISVADILVELDSGGVAEEWQDTGADAAAYPEGDGGGDTA